MGGLPGERGSNAELGAPTELGVRSTRGWALPDCQGSARQGKAQGMPLGLRAPGLGPRKQRQRVQEYPIWESSVVDWSRFVEGKTS